MEKKDFVQVGKYFLLPAMIYFISLYLWLVLDWFSMFEWLDTLFHFIGGLAIGYTGFFSICYFESKDSFKLNRSSRILFSVSFVVLIAVFWEFYEFILQLFGLPTQPSVADTMKDLFIGFSSGFLASFYLEYFK